MFLIRRIKRAALRWWLLRKFGPMFIGTESDIRAWVDRVVDDRIPL